VPVSAWLNPHSEAIFFLISEVRLRGIYNYFPNVRKSHEKNLQVVTQKTKFKVTQVVFLCVYNIYTIIFNFESSVEMHEYTTPQRRRG
jgi:hypothetical protein